MAAAGFSFPDEFAASAVGGTATPVPVAPGEPQVVGVDFTVIQFATAVGVPQNVAASILDVLGDLDLTLEDFAYIDDEDYQAVVGSFTINGSAPGPIQKAQAKKLMAKARATVLAPTSSIASSAPPPAAPVAPAVLTQLKISSFVDQASEMAFALLTPDQLAPYRAKYENVFHVPPPLNNTHVHQPRLQGIMITPVMTMLVRMTRTLLLRAPAAYYLVTTPLRVIHTVSLCSRRLTTFG